MTSASHLWFLYAISASILWGISYAISGKLMGMGLTPAFLMVIQYVIALPFYILIASKTGGFAESAAILAQHQSLLLLMLVSIAAIMCGNFLIMSSISMKNATLASLIEICYPLFTLVFAYILFREVHLTVGTAVGALLVFSGIAVIYLKS